MDLMRLRAAAQKTKEEGREWMPLVVSPRWSAPTGFPRGELLIEECEHENVYRFRVSEILEWFEALELEGREIE